MDSPVDAPLAAVNAGYKSLAVRLAASVIPTFLGKISQYGGSDPKDSYLDQANNGAISIYSSKFAVLDAVHKGTTITRV